MLYYRDPAIFDANRERFRQTHTRRPGPLVVVGVGVTGTLQQVICQPERDTRGRRTRFQEFAIGPDKQVTKTLQLAGKTALYHVTDRGTNREPEHRLAMASVVTIGKGRLNHFATTSSQGEVIGRALKQQPTLENATHNLQSEIDMFATQGITGAFIQGSVDTARPSKGGWHTTAELLMHRPYIGDERSRIHTRSVVLPEVTFTPGEGLGIHAYEGPNGTPYTGRPYTFPLAATAEDTAAMYQAFMGVQRRINVAVCEIPFSFESGQDYHTEIAIINARDIAHPSA